MSNPALWLLGIALGLVAYLAIETGLHRYYLRKIPIRIHVNGSRGKSSVTRLIAAGLRKGGIPTCAKTTGLLAQFIYPDGTAQPFYRPSRATILEQIKAVRMAARCRATALVMECMAVSPALQALSELRLIRATHGVITHAYAEPADGHGPTEVTKVALMLASTTPANAKLYTAEPRHLAVFKSACKDRHTTLEWIRDIPLEDEVMRPFSYIEHKENVALALKVCTDLGVPYATALQGMWEAKPDPKALSIYAIPGRKHRLVFMNAFAAHDPGLAGELWHRLLPQYPECMRRIILMNCRADRRQRSSQFAKACASWEPADFYLVVGTGTRAFIQKATALGIHKLRLIDASSWEIPDIADQPESCLIVGMGNIADKGFEIVDYFRRRSIMKTT